MTIPLIQRRAIKTFWTHSNQGQEDHLKNIAANQIHHDITCHVSLITITIIKILSDSQRSLVNHYLFPLLTKNQAKYYYKVL